MTAAIIILLTIVAIALLIVYISVFYLKTVKTRSKENINYTTLAKEEGKLVVTSENVTKILGNFKNGFFQENGDWHEYTAGEVKQDLGDLFKQTGTIAYGSYPIEKIYEFTEEFTDHVKAESGEVKKTTGNKEEPTVAMKVVTKKVDSFRRFYVTIIKITKIEMKDGSKIDIELIATYMVTNIIRLIFKMKPDGIILSQIETGTVGVIGDIIKSFDSYAFFRDNVNKADQELDPAIPAKFIGLIRKATNDITDSGFGVILDKLEIGDYGLSKGEAGDAEFEASQKAKKIADNLGDAAKTKANADAIAYTTMRDAERLADAKYAEYLTAKLGKEGAANLMAIQAAAKTKLIAYNSPITPVVNVDDSKK